jgi:hypothetical protein
MSQRAMASGFSVFVTLVVISVLGNACDAQTALSDKINLQQVVGPYRYKSPSDLVEVIGFITERTGDTANFRDCKGRMRKVKFQDLVPVLRNCPPNPSSGTWVLNSSGDAILMKADAGASAHSAFFSGRPQIDPASLPAKYREQLQYAKPGDWVATSFVKEGKLDLSFIKKPQM